jgi:hypothetical protein
MKAEQSKMNRLDFLKITSITGISTFLLGTKDVYGFLPPPIAICS